MVHILSELVLRELLVRELLETGFPVRPAEKPLSPCPVEYVRNLPDRIGVDRLFWFRNLLNIGKDFNYGTAFAQSPEIMNCTLPIRFIGEYYVIRR